MPFNTENLNMHNNTFASLLSDLFAVYSRSDKHGLLSQDVLPLEFFENNPEDIVRAHAAYLAKTPDVKTTSVGFKLANQSYESPYGLFHDLIVCCGSEIVNFDVGSAKYIDIDVFFVFCTDLLLREVANLGLRVYNKADKDDDDLLELFRDDYEKISSTRFASNGEFIAFINKFTESAVPSYHSSYNSQTEPETKSIVQPLFSGLVKRSTLDFRNTVVPEPWSLTKAIDQGVTCGSGTTIKSFNSVACKIPLPSQASAQVLDSFFHPNWYTIESPKWLQYKQKTFKPALISTLLKDTNTNELRVIEKNSNIVSLGPVVDSRNSVLSEDLKRKIWFSNIGRKEADNSSNRSSTEIVPEDGQDEVSIISDDDVSVVDSYQEEDDENELEDARHEIEADMLKPNVYGEIKPMNLARYNPESAVFLGSLKSDKDKIVKSPRETQKIISLNLLRLNKLRQERFLHSSLPTNPSPAETALYKKIVKLLSILASSNVTQGKALSLQLKKKIPVLLNDYQGVLPGPMTAKVLTANKTGRLAGIKAPLKKKSRFL